ncbi:MAG: HAD-IC family P-type ATPase, partial [Lactococcus cremoris]
NHPLATAIVRFIGSQKKEKINELDVVRGQGIIADDLLIGNEKLLTAHKILLTDSQKQSLREVEEKGMSIVLVAKAGQLKLIYGIADEIRPDVKEALTALRRNGMKKMVMLTGDNEVTARNVAKELGIDEVHANLLPEEKAGIVSEFKSSGHKLAFIGDGINDSPSLALADIGIAMGSGTDIAIETSDVVLMKSSFAELVQAYGLAKNTVRNMRQNIGLAIAVVIFLLVSLILGGTGFVPNFVNMGTGMFIHEASILVVILNGMRLISYKNKKIN